MSKGYVYVLSNPAMPGLVKIGRTTGDPEARANAINQTGVPMPFKVECAVLFPDCVDAERCAHEFFDADRVSFNREFFKRSADDVRDFLQELLQLTVESFVDEFLPGNRLVEEPNFIDPSAIAIIGLIIGEHPFDVPCILEEVRCDDDVFDIEVLRQRMILRRKRLIADRNRSLIETVN